MTFPFGNCSAPGRFTKTLVAGGCATTSSGTVVSALETSCGAGWTSVMAFRSLRAKRDPAEVKSICEDLEKENRKTCFIAPAYLHSRLRKYYQGRLYQQMRSKGIDWKRLFNLRPMQVIRLLTKKGK